MNKNITGILIITIIVVMGIGVYLAQDSAEVEDTPETDNQASEVEANDQIASNQESEDNEEEEAQDTEPNQQDENEDEAIEASSGDSQYIPYSESSLTSETNVIFFSASWCPTCNALNNDIEENLNDAPGDLTILKADYDSENDLKQKYEVRTQHTLVQVDADGNEINKWIGGNTLDTILQEVR